MRPLLQSHYDTPQRKMLDNFLQKNARLFTLTTSGIKVLDTVSKHNAHKKCQHEMLLHNGLFFLFPHSNSRHVYFNLTFQFQIVLQFSALNMDLVSTCVRSGWRP